MKPLVDAATHVGDRLGPVSKRATLFGRHAFRDLTAKHVALGAKELLALVEQTECLANHLVDGLEVPGVELGSDGFLQFIGE